MFNHPRNQHRVAAGAIALGALVAGACGQPAEAGNSTVAVEGPATVEFDTGPSWQPDQQVLDQALRPRVSNAAPLPLEFGGMAAPWGVPDWSKVDPAPVPAQSPYDQAPTWPPHERRLDSYLDEFRGTGPR